MHVLRIGTFDCFDLEISFLVRRYIHPCQGQVSRSWSQGQGHTSLVKFTFVVRLRLKGNLVTVIIELIFYSQILSIFDNKQTDCMQQKIGTERKNQRQPKNRRSGSGAHSEVAEIGRSAEQLFCRSAPSLWCTTMQFSRQGANRTLTLLGACSSL